MNNDLHSILLYSLGAGCLALAFAVFKSFRVSRQAVGSASVLSIGQSIREGAMAYIHRQYQILTLFVIVVGLALFFYYDAEHKWITLSFIVGAGCSGLAGFFGMSVATAANSRTATAAKTGLNKALLIAFSGGTVMGMCVVGLALSGLTGLLLFFSYRFGTSPDALKEIILPVLSGFSLGASSIALFARVGGGIFTKAADVGADLVGKVEAGIPEDDPRNPATIADNVGDNVGDVAGMGADLFESYVGSIIGAMVLGAAAGELGLVALPIALAGVGILVSIISTLLVRVKDGGNPQFALNIGTFSAAIVTALIAHPLTLNIAPEVFSIGGEEYIAKHLYWAILVGLFSGVAIGLVTEYYTGENKRPTNKIAQASETGAATNIISGLGIGMLSTALPVLLIGNAIVMSSMLAGIYGIAMAALGMLATTGIQLAVDAYGPIADNAGGIAEMSDLPPEVRQRTDKLDAVGNTTAAIGKGFAIGSAALTSLALFAAFQETVGLDTISVTNPTVLAGLFVGAMIPFLFSSMAMGAVGRAAGAMINEVRRQFRENPGIMDGSERPDFARCVDISTSAAIREMILPGFLAIATPLVTGLWFGAEMLGGLLAGVTSSGVLLALFMSNAGGAWDNAKKHIEGGSHGGKGSDAHKAAVVGDTVGDPFKDTAGPAINILIKLMSIVALVLAPLL